MNGFLKRLMVLSAVLVALPAAAQIAPREVNCRNLGSDANYAVCNWDHTTLGWSGGPVAGYLLDDDDARSTGGYRQNLTAEALVLMGVTNAVRTTAQTSQAMTLSGGGRISHVLFSLIDTTGHAAQSVDGHAFIGTSQSAKGGQYNLSMLNFHGEVINRDGKALYKWLQIPQYQPLQTSKSGPPLTLKAPPPLMAYRCGRLGPQRKGDARQPRSRLSQSVDHVLGGKLNGQL